jgi:hypothetical protein
MRESSPTTVVPAKAGTQCLFDKSRWIPAFAGMTHPEWTIHTNDQCGLK